MRDLDPSPRMPSQIVGYEDVRLVSLGNGKFGASATVCDRIPSRRMIARLILDEVGNVSLAQLMPGRQWHEKNWMPVVHEGGQIAWIYSLDPTVIIGAVDKQIACPFALDHLRGGAVVRIWGGYLAVTHEVVEANEGRLYLHRFVKLSENFQVVAVSPAWVFAHHGIEFCAGLARDGEDLVLSYGFEDREAWVMRVSAEEVRNLGWMTP